MKRNPVAVIVLWIPRMLAIVFALMMAMFAMDVFVEGNSFLPTTEAFVLHLIPAACVLVILVLGWRRDGFASLGFLVLGLAYFLAVSGWKHLPGSLVLALPPLGISLAFFARMRLLDRSRTQAR